MWRRRRTKPPRRQQALGLLQDAMRRVEQDRDATGPAPTVLAGVVLDRSDAPLRDAPLRDAPLSDAVPPQAGQARVPPRQKVPPQVRSQPTQPRETSTTGTGGAGW